MPFLIMMPEMDGRAFRREQQKDPDIASIPVIVFTACGASREIARQLGAAGFLNKPLRLDDLLSTIDRASRSPWVATNTPFAQTRTAPVAASTIRQEEPAHPTSHPEANTSAPPPPSTEDEPSATLPGPGLGYLTVHSSSSSANVYLMQKKYGAVEEKLVVPVA